MKRLDLKDQPVSYDKCIHLCGSNPSQDTEHYHFARKFPTAPF